MANIKQDLQAIMDARYGRDVRQSIHDAIYDINEQEEGHVSVIEGYTEDAEAWAKGTKGGTPVESTDPTYHNNAKYYAENIGDTALISEEYAKGTKNGTPVVDGETGYHDNSKYYSEQAGTHAEDAEAWAVGKRNGTDVPSTDPTYENNAKYWQERANYWYQQAQAIAESFSGALRPMGTVAFANLPSVASATAGDMYNISDEFTTTADFEEGAGHVIPLGSNVYKTNGGKWDVLAGSPVTGIKGDSESNYRRGNVNITKTNVGLGNVRNQDVGDQANLQTTATNLVGAINELKSDLNSKALKHFFYKRKNSTDPDFNISLPISDYTEAIVIITSAGDATQSYTFTISSDIVSLFPAGTSRAFRSGYYTNSTDFGVASFFVDAAGIGSPNIMVNGVVLTDLTLHVYYR